jgi:cellulose synthase/poly-beta-1,6-N-acetylglucosamine synthase-like glycosyltransferase
MSQTQAEKFFWRKNPTEEGKQDAAKPKSKDPPPVEETQPKKTDLKSSVLVGIPCHNSESTIAATIVNLSTLGAEIVVCDDGSSDATEEIAKRMGCRLSSIQESLVDLIR